MFSVGMPEVIMILVIALVVFGPGKLPEVGKAIGKGINEFRRATTLEGGSEGKSEPPKAEPAKESAAPVQAKIEEKK